MEPFIRDGDTLVVAPVEATSLRITDVILFTGPAGKPFVHRIVKKGRKDGKPVWITRGDAVMNYTETVSEQQVLGRVIRIQRDAMDHDPGSMLRRLSASLWVLSFPIRYVLGATQARFTRRH